MSNMRFYALLSMLCYRTSVRCISTHVLLFAVHYVLTLVCETHSRVGLSQIKHSKVCTWRKWQFTDCHISRGKIKYLLKMYMFFIHGGVTVSLYYYSEYNQPGCALKIAGVIRNYANWNPGLVFEGPVCLRICLRWATVVAEQTPIVPGV